MDDWLKVPTGELLKDYLSQSAIRKKDLRLILRQRGVFVGRNERDKIIPEIVKAGLGPAEFVSLSSKIVTKEGNPKITTRTIEASSNEITLIEAIDTDFDINQIIDTRYESFEIDSSSQFSAVDGDPDNLILHFKITRFDYSRALHETEQQFDAQIALSRSPDSNEIVITTSHTAEETKLVCNALTQKIIKDFKNSGLVDEKTFVVAIRFSDFSNSSRIAFFKDLTAGPFGDVAKFLSTHDIGLSRVESVDAPKEIEWVEESIKRPSFQGEGLENLYLIQNENLSEFFKIFRIEASYNVKVLNYTGTCRVLFEFAEFAAKGNSDSELSVSVTGQDLNPTTFQTESTKLSQSRIREIIINSIETMKIKLHQKHKNKS